MKQEMTFWEHLDELRGGLIRIGIALIVGFIAFFFFIPTIFDEVILAPCRSDFFLYQLFHNLQNWFRQLTDGDGFAPSLPDTFSVTLINLKLTSQFFYHLSLSLWCAFITTFPYILYQIWLFIFPALTAKEASAIRNGFLLGSILFFMGVALSYFVVFPITLRFLVSYELSTIIQNQLSLESYLDNFILLTLGLGLVFELPILLIILSKFGLITASFLKNYRKHIAVFLLILAAIITPTSDPFTLAIVFLPLYLLFELSIAIMRR